MQKSVILGACAMLALAATDVHAQWYDWPQPLESRLVVSVNGGGQAGSTDINRLTTFELYEEEARIESSQTAGTGGVFDLGASYRVGVNWGVGAAYTASGGSDNARLSGTLPHPLLFSQPRQFEHAVGDLDTRERALHLQAVLYVPFVENVDFTFAAGPSFYSAEQGFSRGVSFTEVPPAYNTVTVDEVEVVNISGSSVGFNISGDMTYSITEKIGAGVLLRYTRASVDLNLGDGNTVEVKPGGFQALFGVRLRF